MATPRPWFWIVGGPNGAGKTTFAIKLLPRYVQVDHFINADIIAAKLEPKAPEKASVPAARIMLEEMQKQIAAQNNFAIESTLASKGHLQTCKQLKQNGWHIGLIYLWLHSPEFSFARIRERVANGGHFVPDDVVVRRRKMGLAMLPQYKAIADRWLIFDNTNRPAQLVAWFEEGKSQMPLPKIWDLIQKEIPHD